MPLIHLLIYAALVCHVWCLLFKKSEILDEVKKILWRMCYLFIDAHSGENRPVEVKVQQLMLQLKVQQFHVVMAVASFGLSTVLAPAVLFFERISRYNATWTFFLMFYIPALVLTFTSLRLSPRLIDVLCSSGMLCIILKVLLVNGSWQFFSFAGSRVMTRVLFSLLFVDIRKTVLWNVLLSIAIWRQYAANITVFHEGVLLPEHWTGFLLIELYILLAVVILAVVAQFLIESRLRATLDAECAHHGMHKLLSALCDAVLRLGPDLHVTSSTPQFLHLLGRQQGYGDSDICTLDGSSFISHIASESDQRRFQDFISGSRSHATTAQFEGGPPALLPLHMQDAQGYQIPVEVFHAHLPDFEQSQSHLLGIRVVGELPMLEAPETIDETIFQHLRGHGSTAPDPHSGLPAALPRRPSSKSSASWESVLTCEHTPLPQIADVSVVIDAFDPRLRMSSCTIHFAVDNEDTPTHGFLDWIVSKDEAQQFLTTLQTFLNPAALGCNSGCLKVGPLLLQLPTLSLDGSFHLISESVSISLQRPASDAELNSDGEDSLSEEHDMFNSEFNTSLPVALKLESVCRLRKVWTRRLKKPSIAPVLEGRRSKASGLRRLRQPK